MLKLAGSIVASGVLGGASYLASDNGNMFLPAVVATVGFVGAMSLFSSLEAPMSMEAPVAAPTQSKAAKKAAAAKREKKPFVRHAQPAAAPSPVAAESSEPEAEEAEEAVEEVKAAPKKKNKKKKAAAAPEPKKEEKKVEKKAVKPETKVPIVPVMEKKEEKKGKGKKAAAAPAPAPVEPKKEEKKAKKVVEEKKPEKKQEKKEDKKGAAAKKAAPVEEKKGKKVEEKKPKKEEKKAAKKKVVESDEESPSADEDEGFTLVKNDKRKSSSKTKEEDLTEDEAEKVITDSITISAKSHGVIIGSNGETLKTVQEVSKARISMPKRESGSETVTITGPRSAVIAAKKILKELEEKGFSQATHPGQQIGELKLNDEKDKGLVIGPGGANLRAIQTATNTRIAMPDKGASLKVLITGSKDNVKRAKQEIKALLADGFTPLTNPSWIKKVIPFPKDQIRTLIGKNGQNIKHIQGVSKGARINTKNAEDSVSVVGTAEQVAIAEKEILRLIAPIEEVAPEAGWGEQAEYNEDDAWA